MGSSALNPIVNARQTIVAILLIAAIGGYAAYNLGFIAGGDYKWTTVEIENSETGDRRTTVDARVADDFAKRYTGLSDTTALEENEGMLFVHEETDTHTYVMRDMNFPLDIIFIDADGQITEIHSAPTKPDTDSLTEYRGEGRYVLEMNKGFAAAHNVSVGDRVQIDLENQRSDRSRLSS